MVYVAAFAGVALASLATFLPVQAATTMTLRGSPANMLELDAVDGGVYVRDTLAVYSESGTGGVDCVLGDWEPVGECDGKTLTQVFVRKANVAPGGSGAACDDVRTTRQCKPVHCQMGEWTPWTDCEEGGYKTRTRKPVQAPLYGGRMCPHGIDQVKCRPEDCLVCAWGEWQCDPTTGKKKRTRKVTRKPQLSGKKCPHLEEEADCDPIDCVLDDGYEDVWSECDANGDKHKHRKVKVQPQYKGKACPAPEEVWQTQKGACPPVACVEEAESTLAFDACHLKDGTTNAWSKKKVIGIKTYPKYGGTECRSESERTVEVTCEPVPCVMDEWKFEGTCNVDGTRKRTRKVLTQAMYGAPECSDQEDEQPDKDECPPLDCVEEAESTSAFDACHLKDGTTNTWSKKKVIGIKTYPKYGGTECRSESERTVEVTCEPVPCVMDEWKFEGTCNVDGTRKRTKKVLTQAMYGAPECSDQEDEQPDKDECPPLDCVEEAESTSAFDACHLKDGTTNAWSKKKVIGIKTYPKYGGTECRSESERTVEVTCEPVPCVMDEWKFEGTCNVDGTRKRTRKVLTQAMYGAPECSDQEDEQLDKDECPPLDCVEEAESTSAFDACHLKDGTTNAWSKKKVIGIKTYPKYGGTECRSESERTVEVTCEPVPCVMDEWKFEGTCNVDGTRKRTRKVLTQAMYGAPECSDQEDEQPDKDECPPLDCVEEAESTSAFDACHLKDGTTNTWSKKKVIGIKTYPKYGGTECRSESERTVEVTCEPVPCVMDEWKFEGTCNVDGTRKRTKKVLTQAMYGAPECSDQEDEQPDKDECPPVACVEEAESTSAFDACHLKDGTTNTWSKKKVIGIKTYPKYGGTECRSESERTVEVTCEPVPCVMDEWKFVGPCNVDGKRKKIREVKSQGMYGAPVCKREEKSELDPVACPPTDCQLGYGWTNWGPCVHNKKKRTTKINVPAKYGGKCSVAEEFASCT